MDMWVQLHFTNIELERIFEEYTEKTGNMPPGKNEKLYREVIREFVGEALRRRFDE